MCNGSQVQRIDTKIPDEIFKFLNVSDATKRIHGIKDYFNEIFYWAIPAQLEDDTDSYPDTILSYNYENNSWAMFDDSITCFGYFEQILSETWEDDYQSWEDDDTPWDSGETVANHRSVIYGNQHGFVAAVSNDLNSNAAALQVSKIDGNTLTINNHNLVKGDTIKLHNYLKDVDGDLTVDAYFKINDTPTDDTITIVDTFAAGYLGGATISRVSKISIKSTAWNPYIKQGQNVYLSKITFAVKKTDSGEITINYIPSQSNVNAIESNIAVGSNLGTYILETSPYELVPLESTQDILWHSVYLQAEGNSVQIHITWTDEQMLESNNVQSNFEIQGLILETSPSSLIG